MTTKVLDLTTLARALYELLCARQQSTALHTANEEQLEFVLWFIKHKDEIAELDGLEALASTDFQELNEFLVDHGFEPKFEPFVGVGAASVLDMLMHWLAEGTATSITRYDYRAQTSANYPAFQVSRATVDIYDLEGYADPLVRLKTKTGHSLWLMKADEPLSGLELNRIGIQLLAETDRAPSSRWTAGAVVPMLEIDTEADMSWMSGFTLVPDNDDELVCEQVFQMFKLRANEKGARVKVATGIVMESVSAKPRPYEVNEPFVGFFTQPGHDTLPLAAFWADTDSWKNSGGTLKEL